MITKKQLLFYKFNCINFNHNTLMECYIYYTKICTLTHLTEIQIKIKRNKYTPIAKLYERYLNNGI